MTFRFTILLLLVNFFGLQAQDTLIKKSTERILGYVLRVDTATVSFHKAAMPDGPVYTIPKDELTGIHYANGHLDSFVTAAVRVQSPQLDNGHTVVANSLALTQHQMQYRIEWKKRHYYQNNVRLSRKEVNFILLQQNNPKVDFYLSNSRKCNIIGKSTGAASIPISIIGTMLMIYDNAFPNNPRQGSYANANSSSNSSVSPVFLVGVVGLVSGAALDIIGYVYKNAAHRSYVNALEQYNALIL
jgi:hypothetical protein